MRIVQLANLYSPVSGGLRTAVDALGRGYLAAGHERVLVIPGRSSTRRQTEAGALVTVPGPSIAPGYRFVLDPRPVLRVLDRLEPDVVEVSDKATLAVAARWARRRGVRSVLFSHERLDAILAPRLPGLARRLPVERALQQVTDRWNRRLADAFDAIVVTSAFAAAEFARVGAPALHLVPLGVDLGTFHPPPPASGAGGSPGGRPGGSSGDSAGDSADGSPDGRGCGPGWEAGGEAGGEASARAGLLMGGPASGGETGDAAGDAAGQAAGGAAGQAAGGAGGQVAGEVRLISLSRLSAEKRPELVLEAAVELRRRGAQVRLDMVGEGPLGPALRRAAGRAGLRAEFHGHVRARTDVARLLSRADVALATCPVESFGLAVLEALACGTPVVAADRGAAGELLVPGAGVAAPATGTGLADGVTEVLGWAEGERRSGARRRAECYPWSATVAGMLRVHEGR